MMTPAEIAALRPRSRDVYQLCQRLGLTVTKRGNVYRVVGRDVDLLAVDLAIINASELLPIGGLKAHPKLRAARY